MQRMDVPASLDESAHSWVSNNEGEKGSLLMVVTPLGLRWSYVLYTDQNGL